MILFHLDLATLYLGTPPRAFQLLVDSGSADLWVGAEDCQDSTNPGDCVGLKYLGEYSCLQDLFQGQHTFLGPSSSSSFNDTKEAWSITYGSGDVSGRIVHDNVRIAGLMLKAHKFGVASGESEDFTPYEFLSISGKALTDSRTKKKKNISEMTYLSMASLEWPDQCVYLLLSLSHTLRKKLVKFRPENISAENAYSRRVLTRSRLHPSSHRILQNPSIG